MAYKTNNIGTGMSTIRSLKDLSYDTSKPKELTVREIIDSNLSHHMLYAKNSVDVELIAGLVKSVWSVTDDEKCSLIKNYMMKYHIGDIQEVETSFLTMKVHCHNCDDNFLGEQLKWTGEEHPRCKNFPICPNPYPEFDIWLNKHVEYASEEEVDPDDDGVRAYWIDAIGGLHLCGSDGSGHHSFAWRLIERRDNSIGKPIPNGFSFVNELYSMNWLTVIFDPNLEPPKVSVKGRREYIPSEDQIDTFRTLAAKNGAVVCYNGHTKSKQLKSNR